MRAINAHRELDLQTIAAGTMVFYSLLIALRARETIPQAIS